MICLTLIVCVLGQLVSLCNHLKQHLLQLCETDAIVCLRFQHLPHYGLDIPISYFLDLFVEHLIVYGVCVEVVKMLHVFEMDHMQERDPKGEDTAFVGQCAH